MSVAAAAPRRDVIGRRGLSGVRPLVLLQRPGERAVTQRGDAAPRRPGCFAPISDRPLFPVQPSPKPQPPLAPVSICRYCGVLFVAALADVAKIGHIVRAHESVCPGGARAGETANPFGSIDD